MSLVAYGADSDEEHSPPSVREAEEQIQESSAKENANEAANDLGHTPPMPSSSTANGTEASADAHDMAPQTVQDSPAPPEGMQGAGTAQLEVDPTVAQAVERLRQMTKQRPGILLDKIQASKQFRNPSIYQKLIEQMGIEETGSNFDPAVYDPNRWTPEDHYKKLRERQERYRQHQDAKRAKRTAVEFTVGKAASAPTGPVIGAQAVDMKATLEAARRRAEAIKKQLKQ
eukprot:TRINITY_DN9873_c0_g1_i1.p1 TRINITY_DN9873_c0_g1~~TRINITY_DN9873_c0_g1_i1.p1  ORF type:complete len:229 (+),score=58.92 TRINITY_DN9873_c0_g1_i1:1460-2146(+)